MLAGELEVTCITDNVLLASALREPASISDLAGLLQQQLGCSHSAALFAFKTSSMGSMLRSSTILATYCLLKLPQGCSVSLQKNTESSLHAVCGVRSRRI